MSLPSYLQIKAAILENSCLNLKFSKELLLLFQELFQLISSFLLVLLLCWLMYSLAFLRCIILPLEYFLQWLILEPGVKDSYR